MAEANRVFKKPVLFLNILAFLPVANAVRSNEVCTKWKQTIENNWTGNDTCTLLNPSLIKCLIPAFSTLDSVAINIEQYLNLIFKNEFRYRVLEKSIEQLKQEENNLTNINKLNKYQKE